jgi:protein-S-isoprenylcysteine O-methyltransferase Ste14
MKATIPTEQAQDTGQRADAGAGRRLAARGAIVLSSVVALEIVIMISPFALFFYAVFNPALLALDRSPATRWLTAFFLPHMVVSPDPALSAIRVLGSVAFIAGAAVFLACAVQVYAGKLLRTGPATRDLYAMIRHPQYLALAVSGFGLAILWPRFLTLVLLAVMLFLYYLLARDEEQRMLARFGDGYRGFMERTGMFSPRCGMGSWGGQCLSMGDYVTGMGPQGGRPRPEGADVAYAHRLAVRIHPSATLYGGNKMWRSKLVPSTSAVILFLFLSGTLFAASSEPKAPPADGDKRVLLTIPFEDREDILRTMRGNLDQISRIVTALVRGDFAAIEKVADELAFNKKKAEGLASRGSAAYAAMGVQLHAVLAEDIKKAAQSRDTKRVLEALDATLAQCATSCHTAFKVMEWPDNKTYQRPPAIPLHVPQKAAKQN